MNTPIEHETRFDVAFSYSAENRERAREIASAVVGSIDRSRVFFDEWYEVELLGAGADIKLQRIFKDESRLVVVCLGGEEEDKAWSSMEGRTIRSMLFEIQDSSGRLKVLPIRVGDGDLGGIFATAIVPDVRDRSDEDISKLILQRLKLVTKNEASLAEQPKVVVEPEIPKDTEKSPEAFISYSWEHDSDQPIVDALCESIRRRGIEVVRDKTHLDAGGRISGFMDRLGNGGCIVVILSDAYLKSEYCMYELYRIYLTANHDDERFLQRVLPIIDGDIKISRPIERIQYAAHWKRERDELDTAAKEYGPEVMGQEDYKILRRMSEFALYVSDMLAYLNDKCMPRKLDEVTADDFSIVTELVNEAVR